LTTLFAFGAAFGFVVLVPDLGLIAALGFAATFSAAGFFATAFFAGDFFVTPPVAAFVFGAGFVAAFFTGFLAAEGGGGAGFLVVAARGRCLRVPAVRTF
jgi:hypothetical protein